MTVDSIENANIVVVDDTVENLQILTNLLKQEGYDVRPVPNGRLAIQAVRNFAPDVILLDINMPQMNGFEVCQHIKAMDERKDIPIIFISARDDVLDKVRAFEVGGVDYLTKPFQVEEVLARVATHIALRRAHLAIERSRDKLIELEELRDNLVHMVVHDMRTPITSIILAIDYLMDQVENQGDNQSVIELAQEAGRRLNRMVDNLLDVSRLEKGKMPIESKPCNLAEIARDVVKRTQANTDDRTIQIDVPDSVPAYCDLELIRRTIENLLNNGLKHTPAGKPLFLTMTKRENEIRVSLRDEGTGVPEAYQDKVFEKFGTMHARTDKKYHSVGLGLAFCKMAVEAHGGRIGVESQEGKGSTFWFTLPPIQDPQSS